VKASKMTMKIQFTRWLNSRFDEDLFSWQF